MSSAYAAVYLVALPKVTQVVDPFHLVRWANKSLDDVRRRVQSEQLGHRGRRDEPLYRVDNCCCAARSDWMPPPPSASGPCSNSGTRRPRSPSPTG